MVYKCVGFCLIFKKLGEICGEREKRDFQKPNENKSWDQHFTGNSASEYDSERMG